jgi:Xaa-Pro aminopeptidase
MATGLARSKAGTRAANRRARSTSATKARGKPTIYADRLKALAGLISHQSTPALLVTNPMDVGYLTGFLGGDSYLLFTPGGSVLISDFRYQQELLELEGLCRVFIRRGSMLDAVAQVLAQERVTRLGLQGEHMTLSQRHALGAKARGVKLIETAGLVARLRARKDAHEVALVRKAIQIQQAALNATLEFIDEGLRAKGRLPENEIAAFLEGEMKKRGSSKPGFETIVAAKANGALPHYRPRTTPCTPNTPLLIDWGATYQGYHGDMTRVFCWGKWPAKIREIYAIVLDAHQTAAAALRPGRTTLDIDASARDVIRAAGYGEFFGHGLGHGVGLDGHEDPRLTNMLEPRPIEPGQIVTIEPGIYLPGVGGVRLEDCFLVTDKGAERLCSMPLSLEWATR